MTLFGIAFPSVMPERGGERISKLQAICFLDKGVYILCGNIFFEVLSDAVEAN
jgi:hypothetical protein